MVTTTVGAKKFGEWRKTNKVTYRRVATLLDCTEASARNWAHCRTTPSFTMIRRIRDVMGIPIDDWAILVEHLPPPNVTKLLDQFSAEDMAKLPEPSPNPQTTDEIVAEFRSAFGTRR